ncbi:MAG: hypothetical protein RLO52_27025 [Sandaracinaceae bacterium]
MMNRLAAPSGALRLALTLSSLALLASCSGEVRGAIVYIDSDLCEVGDGSTPEFDRVVVTVGHSATTETSTFVAGLGEAGCAGRAGCEQVTTRDFPLALPIRSESGSGDISLRAELFLGETQVGCAQGTVPVAPTELTAHDLIIGRSCGAGCLDEAVSFRGLISEDSPPGARACVPATPSPETPIKRVAVGYLHACLIDAMDRLFCWGANSSGQLGIGDNVNRNRPTLVSLGGSLRAVDVSAGPAHTCAVVRNGSNFDVRCWGDNASGQLGNGTRDPATTPVVAGGTQGARQISAGGEHNCALIADGTVKCWGSNEEGELGQPLSTEIALMAMQVPGVENALQVSVGGQDGLGTPGMERERHSCALVENTAMARNDVWCWGSNDLRQLGLDDVSARGPAPLPESVMPGTIVQISAGERHTCAVDGADGRLWCWGLNAGDAEGGTLGRPAASGRDGQGPATIGSMMPVLAQTDPMGEAPPIQTLSAKQVYRCFIAMEDGAPYCFGRESSDRLGSGMGTDLFQPTRVSVPMGMGFIQVAAGSTFACALPDDDTMPFCWGANDDGQLGRAISGETSSAPDRVAACD